MQQGELNQIFKDCCKNSQDEWDWSHHDLKFDVSVDSLTHIESNKTWARKHPDGKWTELPNPTQIRNKE